MRMGGEKAKNSGVMHCFLWNRHEAKKGEMGNILAKIEKNGRKLIILRKISIDSNLDEKVEVIQIEIEQKKNPNLEKNSKNHSKPIDREKSS